LCHKQEVFGGFRKKELLKIKQTFQLFLSGGGRIHFLGNSVASVARNLNSLGNLKKKILRWQKERVFFTTTR
jgi:hypothetical protein